MDLKGRSNISDPSRINGISKTIRTHNGRRKTKPIHNANPAAIGAMINITNIANLSPLAPAFKAR
tara:strand:- start:1360 stop:1554 length:195 start_codon:yes stop_codon:yes gene_type:complete